MKKTKLPIRSETLRALTSGTLAVVASGDPLNTSTASFVYSCIFYSCTVICVQPMADEPDAPIDRG